MINMSFAKNLQRALMVVRSKTGTDFPTQQLLVLLDISSNPDTSMVEVGRRLNMPSSSVSRAVSALSNWSWTKKEGYGLVEKTEDIYEARRKLVRLTQQGTWFINQIKEAFEGGGRDDKEKDAAN